MADKKSVISNTPAVLAATGGFITAIVGLLTFMSAPAPSIGAFDASPNIIALGESSILKWSVSGDGATVTIEPDIGSVALSGTRVVAPEVTTNYTLYAKNGDQQKVASVQIVVRERNETNRMINETIDGVAAKSEIPAVPKVTKPPAEAQSMIQEQIPKAKEPANPDESTVSAKIDSELNAVDQTGPEAKETNIPSSYSAMNQPEMGQSAIAVPSVVIAPDNSNAKAVSSLNASDAAAPETDSVPPDDHVEYGQVQPSATSDAPVDEAQRNGLSDEVDHPSEMGSEMMAEEQKSVKKITAADWGSVINESSSSEDFESNAPIYAKIAGTSRDPASDSYFQDPAAADQGPASEDFLGNDMQSQDSSMMNAHLPGS